MSWAAHGLPFVALFLVIGLVARDVALIACAAVVALCSALFMAARRRRGQPMSRE